MFLATQDSIILLGMLSMGSGLAGPVLFAALFKRRADSCDFHWSGGLLALALCSNTLARQGTMDDPADLRRRAVTPSGPVALPWVQLAYLCSMFSLLIVVSVRAQSSGIVLLSASAFAVTAGPISRSATVQKYLFSKFAFSLLSAVRVPSGRF